MSVIEYGDYVEGNVRIVRYTGNGGLQDVYSRKLVALRRAGCTITPLAYNDIQNSRFLLYIPTTVDLNTESEVGFPDSVRLDIASALQIITSLHHMYLASYCFDLLTRELAQLAESLTFTKENIAISNKYPMSGVDFTVFGVPYCILSSELLTSPKSIKSFNHLNKGLETYSALRLIPYIMIKTYSMQVTIGGMLFHAASDNLADLLSGDHPNLSLQDYLTYVENLTGKITVDMESRTYYHRNDDEKIQELSHRVVIASTLSIVAF